MMSNIIIIYYILFVFFYAWSTKITEINGDSKDKKSIFEGSHILNHFEDQEEISYILNSSVCKLGYFSFFAWIIFLPILVYFNFFKLLKFLFFLTLISTLFMNFPYFIRSIPAFIFLGFIIFSQ